MVKAVPNLLPDIYLNRLKKILDDHSRSFDWYWNSLTASDTKNNALDNNFMFTHLLFHKDTNHTSPYFETFLPILYFLNQHIMTEKVYRMKLNLYPNQGKTITHAKHIDLTDKDTSKPLKDCKITVFNFTTCNGGTIINDKKYSSNANEALIFDNEIEHQGFTQTDTSRRIILNIATGIK
jgi:hypothetical protein